MEKNRKKFNLTSNRLNLDLVEWGNMLSVYSIKNDSNKLFFISQATGAFAIKMCSDIVPTYFATRLLQELEIPTPDVKILPFYESEFKAMVYAMERLTMHDD